MAITASEPLQLSLIENMECTKVRCIACNRQLKNKNNIKFGAGKTCIKKKNLTPIKIIEMRKLKSEKI
jgi:hypothetical protein